MAFARFETFQFVCNTSTGNQTLSMDIDGHTPAAMLIEITGATANDTNTDDSRIGFGMTDGTTSRALCSRSEDAVIPSDTGRRDSDDLIEISLAANNATDGRATFVSFDTDEAVINWADAPASAYRMNVTVFWGDMLDAEVVEIKASTTEDGSVSISSLSFAPNMALFFTVQGDFGTSAAYNQNILCHGFAVLTDDGSIEQGCYSQYDRDNKNVTTAAGTMMRNDAVNQVVVVSGVGGVTFPSYQEVTAFNSDGLDITTRDGTIGPTFMVLCLRMGDNYLTVSDQDIETATTGTGSPKLLDPGWPVQGGRVLACRIPVS